MAPVECIRPTLPPGGLGCCPFSGGGSVVVDFFCVSHYLREFCVGFVLVCITLHPFYFAIILTRKGELVALLLLSFWCLVTVNVLYLFLMVTWVGLQFMTVVFPDHSHLRFKTLSENSGNFVSTDLLFLQEHVYTPVGALIYPAP